MNEWILSYTFVLNGTFVMCGGLWLSSCLALTRLLPSSSRGRCFPFLSLCLLDENDPSLGSQTPWDPGPCFPLQPQCP